MFYDEGSIDESSLRFTSDDEKACILCGPWGSQGMIGTPNGTLKLCLWCNGTGKKGGKSHSLQPEIFQSSRREEFTY